MADLWMDVDVALTEVPVNLLPLLDATDFKTIEGAVAYNAAGMALFWHFVTVAGVYNNGVAVTPTTGGDYDWTDHGAHGIYTIEIPASGGASINNDTEGFGWFTGSADGVLPWRGPVIGFRPAGVNDALVESYAVLEKLTYLPAEAPLDAAGLRTAVGLATANLDTQFGLVATAANLALVKAVTDALAVKKNTALANFTFVMRDSTTKSPKTGLTVTCTRKIDGGAFGAGTLANVAEIGNGLYKVDFGAGDLNGTVVTLRATAAGADDTFVSILTTV